MVIKLNKTLIKGSLTLLILFGLFNLINFLFQSFMAYKLSPADYGVLGALYYIIYFTGIFTESIQTVITKYTSGKLKDGKIKNIINRSFKNAWKYSLGLFIFYLLIIIPLSILTEIPYPLFALTGLVIFTSFFLPITRGVLQGRKKFVSLGSSLIVESGVKLLLALAFVFFGWKVYGAMAGTVIGFFASLLFSFIPLRKVLKAKEKYAKTLDIRNYSKPVLVLILSMLAFYTVDIIIAQIIFPKDMAGYYTIASVLSKIVFWGTQPVSKAMFPITAGDELDRKSKTDKGNYFVSLLIVSFLIVCALVVFYFFSADIIRLFSGKSISNPEILFYLSMGTSVLSFANLNILHKASRGKTKGAYAFLVILAIGIGLMFLFNNTLVEYSFAFLGASVMFLIGSIILLNEK